MNLVYVFGAPAAGKSTLMAKLTGGCPRFPMRKPFAHELLISPQPGQDQDILGIELGRSREAFPGTDTLGLNVSPLATAFVAGQPSPLILAEGDRLAHSGFLDAAAAAGYAVTGVYLTVPDELLEQRCAQRGSQQSLSWRVGRATKAARLTEHVASHHYLLTLDGATAPAVNVGHMVAAVPALAALATRVSP